jgi:predicted GNAT family N-acyltransferase
VPFTAAIFRGDEVLIDCELIYVFANPSSQTSKPVPPLLREIFAAYEEGESMVRVRTGSWAELGDQAKRIRSEVFLAEQQIPADMEWDDGDAIAVHAVAYNRLEQAVATGRLLQQWPGVARIGRVAVHRVLRGSGIGRQVMQALLAAAIARGDREVMLHAQCSAQNFYLGLGFQPRGEPFEEAGIDHIEMVRQLVPN